MREIVEAYPDLSRPTVDLLTAYLAQVNYHDEEPPADVRAIMAMITAARLDPGASRMPHPNIKPLDAGGPLDLTRAFIRRTVLDHAVLRGANLTEADMTNASARFADFTDAVLDRTILRGTDPTGARITAGQLRAAIVDDRTVLPAHLRSG